MDHYHRLEYLQAISSLCRLNRLRTLKIECSQKLTGAQLSTLGRQLGATLVHLELDLGNYSGTGE